MEKAKDLAKERIKSMEDSSKKYKKIKHGEDVIKLNDLRALAMCYRSLMRANKLRVPTKVVRCMEETKFDFRGRIKKEKLDEALDKIGKALEVGRCLCCFLL